MNWYYAENNQRNGPVSEDEFAQLVRDGKIAPATLVWSEGMAGWKPFREVAPTLPPPLPDPEEEAAAVSEDHDGPPWENRSKSGMAQAVLETIKAVLFNPSIAFSQMKRSGGFSAPLKYLLLVGGVASYIATVYDIIYQHVHGYPTPGHDWTIEYVHHPASYAVFLLIFAVFMLPLVIVTGAFIYSWVLHLCLRLFGAAKRPYETTLRVVCYSFGSNAVWRLIPLFGSYVFLISSIMVTAVGIARAHEISIGKALIAVLLPAVFCFFVLLAVFALFFSLALAAGGHP